MPEKPKMISLMQLVLLNKEARIIQEAWISYYKKKRIEENIRNEKAAR
jgi:hypothetical protein